MGQIRQNEATAKNEKIWVSTARLGLLPRLKARIHSSTEITRKAAKKISAVEGVEPSDWAGDVTLDKLEKVVASIEKAGVPEAYTDLLDQALDNAFD